MYETCSTYLIVETDKDFWDNTSTYQIASPTRGRDPPPQKKGLIKCNFLSNSEK